VIPFLDLKAAYDELRDEIDSAIHRVLGSGRYILGPEVEAFEAEWATYCGTEHSVGVANGLDALILALRALGVGPGDEVLVPSNTYIATWLAVTAVGAQPVPVEPDASTFNMDPERIADAVTVRTKAIIPVHLYGQPADLDATITIARHHGLSIVEDAAQAHGARYKGMRIGGHSDVACWSFYPGKNLGALGDGGAITTNRADVADRIRVLRNYGSRSKYHNEVQGVNSRLDPMQAAVLRAKLPHLEAWTQRRRELASLYTEGLRETDAITPHVPDWAEPVWHLYVIKVQNRDHVQKKLADADIDTLIHYPIPPHLQVAYQGFEVAGLSLPLATRIANEVLSLPMGPHLSVSDAEVVIDAVRRALM